MVQYKRTNQIDIVKHSITLLHNKNSASFPNLLGTVRCFETNAGKLLIFAVKHATYLEHETHYVIVPKLIEIYAHN